LPPLFDKHIDGGRTGIGAGRLVSEKRARWRGATRPYQAVTLKPRQPFILPTLSALDSRFQTRDRTSAVNNQHRRPSLKTVDQGTQAVLSLGHAHFLHLAK
jgi:hypothetical protein